MFALVIENTRLLVAFAAGVIVLLDVFSTPTRTLPFIAFTALPSVTGHCVEAGVRGRDRDGRRRPERILTGATTLCAR